MAEISHPGSWQFMVFSEYYWGRKVKQGNLLNSEKICPRYVIENWDVGMQASNCSNGSKVQANAKTGGVIGGFREIKEIGRKV